MHAHFYGTLCMKMMIIFRQMFVSHLPFSFLGVTGAMFIVAACHSVCYIANLENITHGNSCLFNPLTDCHRKNTALFTSVPKCLVQCINTVMWYYKIFYTLLHNYYSHFLFGKWDFRSKWVPKQTECRKDFFCIISIRNWQHLTTSILQNNT